jgi:tripartite-type tricarboxylate transporter receptor subunit TctC
VIAHASVPPPPSAFAASSAALAAAPRPGWAQAYPTRPITLTVFVAAGGAPDIVAASSQALSQRLGQPIVIDNGRAAAAYLALQAVARAPPTATRAADRHASRCHVTLYETQPVNVLRDIVPVASIDDDAFVLMVNNSIPARTMPELIAYAKANPRKLNMSSSGTGNLSPWLVTVQDDDRHR